MKKFIALVALLCTVMISSTTAAAANWVWIRSDDKFTHYVDNNSIRRDYNYSGYVFRAFVKIIYNEAGRTREIEQCRANGRPLPRGIYNLSHYITLEYFKAADGMKYVDLLNLTHYTRDGNTIPEMGGSKNSPQWKIVTPDSIAEALFDAIYARVPN